VVITLTFPFFFTPYEELNVALSYCHVGLFPTRAAGGPSLIALRTAAAGVPVIMSNVMGNRGIPEGRTLCCDQQNDGAFSALTPLAFQLDQAQVFHKPTRNNGNLYTSGWKEPSLEQAVSYLKTIHKVSATNNFKLAPRHPSSYQPALDFLMQEHSWINATSAIARVCSP